MSPSTAALKMKFGEQRGHRRHAVQRPGRHPDAPGGWSRPAIRLGRTRVRPPARWRPEGRRMQPGDLLGAALCAQGAQADLDPPIASASRNGPPTTFGAPSPSAPVTTGRSAPRRPHAPFGQRGGDGGWGRWSGWVLTPFTLTTGTNVIRRDRHRPAARPLESQHRELGATFAPFGGWLMPVSYGHGQRAQCHPRDGRPVRRQPPGQGAGDRPGRGGVRQLRADQRPASDRSGQRRSTPCAAPKTAV